MRRMGMHPRLRRSQWMARPARCDETGCGASRMDSHATHGNQNQSRDESRPTRKIWPHV